MESNDENSNYYRLFYHAFCKPFSTYNSFTNRAMLKLIDFNVNELEFELESYGYNRPGRIPKYYYLLYSLLKKNVKKPRKNDRRLVKSVHCVLSLPFILEKHSINCVIVLRNPLSVFSSQLGMNNPDIDRKLYRNSRLMHSLGLKAPNQKNINHTAGWQISLFYRFFNLIRESYPEIIFIKYEDFLEDSVGVFQQLYKILDLEWSSKVANTILSKNKSGSGYQTFRNINDQIDVWKNRLTDTEIQEFKKGYSMIENPFYQLD